MSLAATTKSFLKVSLRVKTEWAICLHEAPRSFFVSAEEARGQVEDGIKCSKVTALSRGAVGPDPSKHCLYDS